MIYQHWIGTVTPDTAADKAAPWSVDLWLPAEAPQRASRFEHEPWQAAPLGALTPAGGCFAGTIEYWYGDEDDEEEEE
jgi:hypothetical protein